MNLKIFLLSFLVFQSSLVFAADPTPEEAVKKDAEDCLERNIDQLLEGHISIYRIQSQSQFEDGSTITLHQPGRARFDITSGSFRFFSRYRTGQMFPDMDHQSSAWEVYLPDANTSELSIGLYLTRQGQAYHNDEELTGNVSLAKVELSPRGSSILNAEQVIIRDVELFPVQRSYSGRVKPHRVTLTLNRIAPESLSFRDLQESEGYTYGSIWPFFSHLERENAFVFDQGKVHFKMLRGATIRSWVDMRSRRHCRLLQPYELSIVMDELNAKDYQSKTQLLGTPVTRCG